MSAGELRFLLQWRWIGITVLMALLIPAFWHLSTWQFHRLDVRRAANSEVASATAAAPKPLATLLMPGGSPDWTPTIAIGKFEAQTTRYARRHWREDKLGFWVVDRFAVQGGGDIAVVRGFTPTTRTAGTTPEVSPPPRGTVRLVGWLRSAEPLKGEAGAERQINSVNNAAMGIGEQELTDKWLLVDHRRTAMTQLTTSSVSGEVLLDIAPPEPSEGPHHSYAWQWRAFTILVIAGWLSLVRTEVRQQRTQR